MSLFNVTGCMVFVTSFQARKRSSSSYKYDGAGTCLQQSTLKLHSTSNKSKSIFQKDRRFVQPKKTSFPLLTMPALEKHQTKILNSPTSTPPRILIVSRRFVRKSKYVNFVGEFHLNLVVHYGGCPIIVPRVENISHLLDAFEPIHGVLLVEGQDISSNFIRTCYEVDDNEVALSHPEDVEWDYEKDAVEFELVRRALDRNIPLLGICRGSQIINVAAGGSILPDIDKTLKSDVRHIDYKNYDGHRHPVSVLPGTPLHEWFDGEHCLSVNSYHHQGVDRLAHRFVPMAYAPDGLIEAFYDQENYDPEEGKFLVGLQFHPERMQETDMALEDKPPVYDYPGCTKPFEMFVKSAVRYKSILDEDSRFS